MATRILSRAFQQASRSPYRFSTQQESFTGLGCGRFQLASLSLVEENPPQPWIPASAFGSPPHKQEGRDLGSFFFYKVPSPESALLPILHEQIPSTVGKLGLAPSFVLAQEPKPEMPWKLTNSNYFPACSDLDEMIMPSLHEETTSPMLMSTKRTFNPSTIVRKRRHGFLARKATVGGRRILARRLAKGRRRLSA